MTAGDQSERRRSEKKVQELFVGEFLVGRMNDRLEIEMILAICLAVYRRYAISEKMTGEMASLIRYGVIPDRRPQDLDTLGSRKPQYSVS